MGGDRTTVRGGYQITYQLPGDSFSWIDVDIGGLPGFVYQPDDYGDGSFRDFSDIEVPIDIGGAEPFRTIPITERSQTLRVHHPDYETPYVQTFTLGVTHALRPNLTLDVKYVGTRGMKMHETYNLNAEDIRGNGLLQALEITRAGGDAEIFDRMLGGLNIGSGVVGVDVTGSEALRRHSSTRTDIANGDFVDVADWLNRTNTGPDRPDPASSGAGCFAPAGSFPKTSSRRIRSSTTFTLAENVNSSIYHSLQVQATLRRDSRHQLPGHLYLEPEPGHLRPGRGRFPRPEGAAPGLYLARKRPNARFPELRNVPPAIRAGTTDRRGFASGWVARLIEGWQIGTIVNLTSGAPLNHRCGPDALWHGNS